MAEGGEKTMASEQMSPSATGWGALEAQYRKMKENAEAYPYVWASYIVVYGGFGLWMTYRWRKLRKTEDRVRVLQERLRNIVQAEEQSAAASASKSTPLPNKAPK